MVDVVLLGMELVVISLMVSVGLFKLVFRSVDVWGAVVVIVCDGGCVVVVAGWRWAVQVGIVGIVGGSGFVDLDGVAD